MSRALVLLTGLWLVGAVSVPAGAQSAVPTAAVPTAAGSTAAGSTAAGSTAAGSTALPRGVVRVRLSVATRALQRGETLQAGDIAVVDTTMIWRWNTVAPDTTRAQIGWMVNRPIAAGEVLRAPAVGAPPVVMAGHAVSVVYQDGPVRLQLAGVATNSAPLGAPVGVRIDATRRLDGIAVAPNTVRLR